MAQTRKQSLTETVISTIIGYVVALITNAVVLPWYGYHTTFSDNIGIACVFTLVSLVRGYFVRRYFNWRHELLNRRKRNYAN